MLVGASVPASTESGSRGACTPCARRSSGTRFGISSGNWSWRTGEALMPEGTAAGAGASPTGAT
jgi:hypothetical protein